MKFTLLAVAAVAVAAPVQAQTRTSADSTCTTEGNRTECALLRRMPGDSAFRIMSARMDSEMSKRAALGIELRATGTRRDTLGVFVESVTPKGPAENAGIVEGDRIAAINGVDLRSAVGDVEDPYTNGLASHRLSREVQKLSPGARVNLRVYSGGRFRDVQLIAGRALDVMRLGRNKFEFGFPAGGMMEFNGHMPMIYGGAMPAMPPMQFRKMVMPRGQFRVPSGVRLVPGTAPKVLRLNGDGQRIRVETDVAPEFDSWIADENDDAFTWIAPEDFDFYFAPTTDSGK